MNLRFVENLLRIILGKVVNSRIGIWIFLGGLPFSYRALIPCRAPLFCIQFPAPAALPSTHAGLRYARQSYTEKFLNFELDIVKCLWKVLTSG